MGSPFYGGNFYAGLNPTQLNAVNAMRGFSTGQGGQFTGDMMGAAGTAMGATGAFGDQSQAIYNKAMKNPTQGILNSAGQYADNPYLTGQIDAVLGDLNRNMQENLLPGEVDARVAGGNLGSTRSDIAQGIIQRGVAENMQDVSAGMRGDAWNQGVQTALNARGQGLDAALGATGQTGALAGMGMNFAPSALGASYGNFDRALQSGSILQGDTQAQLDEAYQKWLGQDQRPLELLQNYGNTLGQFNTGSQTTTTNPSPGFLQQALGMGATGMGLYGAGQGMGLWGTQPQAGAGGGAAGSAAALLPFLMMMG